MDKKQLINIILSTILILAIGLLSGYSIGYIQAKRTTFPDVKKVDDLNPGITTVKFLKLDGNKLMGRVDGNSARIAYSPEAIFDINEGQSFEIPIYSVNLANFYTASDLPEETEYIASAQGKYFYHILDPSAFKITPKNRIYFTTKIQALDMGYLPKE